MPTSTSNVLRFMAALVAASAGLAWGEAGPAVGLRAGADGARDAAVVVAIERYYALSTVPGARENGLAWYDYLTQGRAVPAYKVALLMDDDATAEGIRTAAVKAARDVESGGRLWFIFIGHGHTTPAAGPLLVAVDAHPKVASIVARSVAREPLRQLLESSRAQRVIMLLDAGFAGLLSRPEDKSLPAVPQAAPVRSSKTVILTAAAKGRAAGPLPGAARPAFSLLALGALRGWADVDQDGQVTGAEVRDFVTRILAYFLTHRHLPTVEGAADAPLVSSTERRLDVDALMGAFGFRSASTAGRRVLTRAEPSAWYMRKRVWGWLGLGIGAGVALAGIPSTLTAYDLRNEGETASAARRTVLQTYIDSNNRTAALLYGFGGAIAVTGVVLLILGDKAPRKPAATFELAPAGLGLSLLRRF